MKYQKLYAVLAACFMTVGATYAYYRSTPELPKITPVATGSKMTVSQLLAAMQRTDFGLLLNKDKEVIPVDDEGNFIKRLDPDNLASGGAAAGNHLNLADIPDNRYEVREDPEHIQFLVDQGRLNPSTANMYQKIMLYIVVHVNNRYYKLYVNDPLPGMRRPGSIGYPADRTLEKYNV